MNAEALLASLSDGYECFNKKPLFLSTSTGAAGLITSINRIVTKLLVHDEKINTLTFFVLSAIMVLVCLVTYHLARKTDFVRYYMVACTRDGYEEHPQLNQYDRVGRHSNFNQYYSNIYS